ncbi:reverse transcriptase domain-containing protein, partial [Bacillus cereus]|nr:reverse transcriptase domain-containing protein [Bacillus cereus]
MKDNKQFPQNEKELKLALDSMYRIAKESSKPFYNLIELMKNEQTILTAVHNIKGNKGSKTAGTDGKTMDYYLQMGRDKLMSLIRRNINNYQPSPVRRKYIPKSNGKQRPLGIPNMIDRIIQEIAKIVIEPIAEAKFYHYSFGFRPMRSAEQAIAETLERIRRSKTYWVIEGDIKGYFDNINHNKLIEIMWKIGIRDKRVLMM